MYHTITPYCDHKVIKEPNLYHCKMTMTLAIYLVLLNAALIHGFALPSLFSRHWRAHPQRTSNVRLFDATTTTLSAFDLFCRMRTGVGSAGVVGCSKQVYWAGSGSLYQAYSGEILADFYGVDVAQGLWLDDSADRAASYKKCCRQLSRKAFWFTHPGSLDVMTEYQGQPVKPILYNAQVFDFKTTNGKDILPSVVSSTRDVPVQAITSRQLDKNDCVLFQAPVFVDITLPPGDKNQQATSYQAWEFYDYNVDPTFSRPPTAVWTRQGSTVPFDTQQNAVLRFAGQRYEHLQDLPAHIQERLQEKDLALYQGPPKDMTEVQGLQRQQKQGKT